MTAASSSEAHSEGSLFGQGFRAMLPIWLSVLPIAWTYTLSAQQGGLSFLETQLMSLLIFSAPAQINLIHLFQSDAPVMTMIGTTIVLMLHIPLYAVSLHQKLALSRSKYVGVAGFLTDSSYAVTVAANQYAGLAYLFGAELSMFAAWNIFTLLGSLLSSTMSAFIPTTLSTVAPLTFFAMLMLTVRSRWDVVIAILSGLIMLGARSTLPSSLVLILAIVIPVLVGAIGQHQ